MSVTKILPPEIDIAAFNRDEAFAAAFVGSTVETLRTWRKRGCGPPWKKLNGLVRYSLASLQEWVESKPGGGTSDHGRLPQKSSGGGVAA